MNAGFALNLVTGKGSNVWVLNGIYLKMLITTYINHAFFSSAKTSQLYTLPSAPATFSAIYPKGFTIVRLAPLL